MTTTATSAQSAAARLHRRRRRWLLAGLAIVLTLGILVIAWLYWDPDRDLRDAIAEVDRLDPGWRFDDIEAARAVLADADNSALVVQAAFAKIPPGWLSTAASGTPRLEERLEEVPLPHRPAQADLDELHVELKKAAAALDIALKLADLPRGRYAVAWSADLIGTLVPHVNELREVARLLLLHAVLRSAQEHPDADGAVRSCQAALNAGRSVGDEPTSVSQLVRRNCGAKAVLALEAVLARCEASARPLEEMQRLLTAEAAEPLLLIMARAARAAEFQALDMMHTGQFNRTTYQLKPSWFGSRVDGWVDGHTARLAQAAYLRHWTAYVEIAKLPTENQQQRLQQLATPTEKLPPLLAGLSGNGSWAKLGGQFINYQAQLRCAMAALAAERYRLAERRWPETLDALVPGYIAAVPLDPFDGRPLRLRRLSDGLVIYSIGPDCVDDGGNLNREQPDSPGTDIGFQLWDPKSRGPASASQVTI